MATYYAIKLNNKFLVAATPNERLKPRLVFRDAALNTIQQQKLKDYIYFRGSKVAEHLRLRLPKLWEQELGAALECNRLGAYFQAVAQKRIASGVLASSIKPILIDLEAIYIPDGD